MAYTAKNYSRLLGTEGFSEKLLKTHFKLYEGYVAHLNQMILFLNESDKSTQEYEEIKRRFAWEYNGVRLHEAYFGNLKKDSDGLDLNSALAQQIAKDFGSMDEWEKDFRAVAAMRGIGWAVFVWDPESRRFFNVWIDEHATGHLVYSIPLLVCDVFEHAYMVDYSMDRKSYTEAFMRAIDWEEVQKRYDAVLRLSSAYVDSL